MVRLPQMRNESGFTLVELIITATFVAAASTAIIGIFISVSILNAQARNISLATALAEKKLETYRDAGYSAIPTGNPAETFTSEMVPQLGSPRSATTIVTVPQAGLKQVDVKVMFTQNGRTQNIQLSTLVAQRGINR